MPERDLGLILMQFKNCKIDEAKNSKNLHVIKCSSNFQNVYFTAMTYGSIFIGCFHECLRAELDSLIRLDDGT